MSDFIFLQTSPNTVVVGSGSLKQSELADADNISFYVNDFFLTYDKPWIIAEKTEELSLDEFKNKFLDHPSAQNTPTPVTLDWKKFDQTKFRKFFSKIKLAFNQGLLEKIVPVVFEQTELTDEWKKETLKQISSRTVRYYQDGLFFHGFSLNGIGRCGLTPEVIVDYDGTTIQSFALAGTKRSSLGEKSLNNPKDAREHQLVVEDIKNVLNTFGKCTVEKTTPFKIGSLVHLKAPISVRPKEKVGLNKIVESLHPTAALGVYPRSPNAQILLKSSDSKINREQFAGPFGVQYPNLSSFCIASIRSCFWDQDTLKIMAGCGIIEESDIELEIEELNIKLQTIKEKLV